MKKTVLVTGGNGYVGTAVAWLLAQQNFDVIVVDQNLPVQSIPGVTKNYLVDLNNAAEIYKLFSQHQIEVVFHCAALTSVAESMATPQKYYANNCCATLHLLEAMAKFNVKKIVFSSSAAVYGLQNGLPIEETARCEPLSSYGKSKWFVEQMLPDFEYAFGIRHVALRYFNVAGAIFTPEFVHGEMHTPETHLIPLTIHKILNREPLEVFGFELGTHDGSAVRDFVHLLDVAWANVLALHFLVEKRESAIFNICSGRPISVLEVVALVEKNANMLGIIKPGLPRVGDPVVLVGNAGLAAQRLGWEAYNSGFEQIIQDAFAWSLLQKNIKSNSV